MRIQQICCCQPLRTHNKSYQQKQVNFGVNELKGLNATEKLIVDFLASEELTKYKLRWKDAVKMCLKCGHKIVTKQGSHAELRIAGGKGIIPLVMPHESEKMMGLLDKKRIRAVLTGDIETAFRLH